MNRYSLKLLKKEKVASNAWAFILEQPEGFKFEAGQYIRIYDRIVGETVFRDFTIASSPHRKDSLLLIIKEGISEYKKHLFDVKVEQNVIVDAPLGRFYINEEEKSPLVFIAGGVGITPFYSMIEFAQQKSMLIPMTLLASFSKVEDILFFDELKNVEHTNNSLQIAYTVSQPEKSAQKWDSHTGRISENLINEYVKDLSIPTFFLCGSPSFVIDMEDLLTNMGVNARQIRVEVFLGFT